MIAIIKNGQFTGTQYTNEEFGQFKDFHLDRGELFVEVDSLAIDDESGEVSVEPTQEQIEEAQKNAYIHKSKAEKIKALSSLTVTISTGKTFDANEASRNNMLAAIQASEVVGATQTAWKLADNTIEIVTLDELKEAIALSIQEVGKIIVGEFQE